MKKVLTPRFFSRPTLVVAEKILGKFLVRRCGKKTEAYMITEVEAYDGHKDKASHGSRGRNKRSEIMFGPPGYWFIYLTYGMYWMLNVVTGEEGYPAAVLIRGLEGINGPARVTKKLKIGKSFSSKAAVKKSGLWIEDRGVKIRKAQVKKTRRVGVEYARKYWANRKYRFVLVDSV